MDKATKFIPTWVKVAVALALGMGTMVGWKRIVVTVGEKIGKEHLTYAQGACAELVAMATIFAADNFGLPVSTTHVLSSGVAGTMAANKSGLQFSTIRNIAAAWVFTLPAAALLSGPLFWLFRQISHRSSLLQLALISFLNEGRPASPDAFFFSNAADVRHLWTHRPAPVRYHTEGTDC